MINILISYIKRLPSPIKKLIGFIYRFFNLSLHLKSLSARFIQKELMFEIKNNKVAQIQLMLHYQYLRDQNLPLPKFQDTGCRVFSQNDEDGLLLYIFSLIGTTNKQCLDVAFAGPYGANTTNLICNWGWGGLLI